MSVHNELPAEPVISGASFGAVLLATLRHHGVQATAALWVVGYLVVLWLADGSLPFDRPAVAKLPFALQLAAPSITLIEIFLLMGLVFLLTRRRAPTPR